MTANIFGSERIDMPALVYMDGRLFADTGDGLRLDGVRFVDNKTMLCRLGSRSEMPGWILEINGNFRELSFVSDRREWARPLRFLWNFALAEYRVTLPREITVDELYTRVKSIKDEFPEAPLAADLRRFLKKFPSDKVVTRDVLKEWPL